ncbi:hypothetical protein CHLRE_07g316526v5 [Chlamydomonas reinhardtii]|uniref:AB hydrolase-1 domain-containing protein n=1 Tax=Chlamydomonas reinhardtii TaxID=3055 RepID=A0A2K3DIQ2_CHLRE|nr:uncharacterized protein CHLRE_07g316526v5 [Chlamydomonas reinhardtii]PNW80408.1 hypothetical protein CHLRE_07g316526v5 [Chlamydomonas reinhardtii]
MHAPVLTVRSDGYHLALFRLVLNQPGRSGASPSSTPAWQQQPQRGGRPPRPPVLLHHGFPLSANAWLALPREEGLPYLLADRGYDVWILSERGSTHSLSHDSLSPNSKEFWRYTADDMALHDLPALADHVRAATGAPRIATLSWSAGGTMTFMYGSEAPAAAAERFCAHVALAPVVFPQRLRTPLFAGLSGSGADKALDHLDALRFPGAFAQAVLGPLCGGGAQPGPDAPLPPWGQLLLPYARRGGPAGLGSGGSGGGGGVDGRGDGGGGRPAACAAALLAAYGPVGRASVAGVEHIAEVAWPSTFGLEYASQFGQRTASLLGVTPVQLACARAVADFEPWLLHFAELGLPRKGSEGVDVTHPILAVADGELICALPQMYRRGPHDPMLLKYNYGVVCAPWHARGGDGSCNQAEYGSATTPQYNVSRYSIPTTIFTGGLDAVSVPWDSENVAAALKAAAAAPGGGGGGGALRRLVHLPSYGHVDLVWYDARPILDDVLRALQETC